MKTGNGRRRKLSRLAKARALRERCQWWLRLSELKRKNEDPEMLDEFLRRIARYMEEKVA
jgi:hypothetical protein